MAKITEKDNGATVILPEGAGDVQTVTITREQARAMFDGEPLGDDFDTALDTVQGATDGITDGVLILIVKGQDL